MLEAVIMICTLPMRKLLELCFQCKEDDHECYEKAGSFALGATILMIVVLVIFIYMAAKK